jgi:AraC family transcriptional regulator of arabinose operon
MLIAEGFPGQRLVVVPRSLVNRLLSQPGTSHLVVTDCGYFPHATAHGRRRDIPINQAIIVLCTRGSGWYRFDGEISPVHAGQVMIVPPGLRHEYGAEANDPWTLWWLHVAGSNLADLLSAIGFSMTAAVQDVNDVSKAVSLIDETITAMERDLTPVNMLEATGASWHLLCLLANHSKPGQSRSELINGIREFLWQHPETNMAVRELADRVHLSVPHFAALFRDQVGVPIRQYHIQSRMARARDLLDTTDLSVSAIAEKIGYGDPHYFSRQFHVIHHLAPLKYRQHGKG